MVFEKIREMLATQFDKDPEEITMDTDVQEDFNADSIDIVDLLYAIEDEFDVVIPKTVGQFTGLHDKNGKEIYEGDIVNEFVCGVKTFKGKPCGRHTNWQVRWNDEECCFELHYLSGSLFGDSMMSNTSEYEVIGTIHENPELLEGEE